MGVVAAGTGKGPFRAPWILDALHRVTANRMALDHTFKRCMAAHAEFVDWFIELETILRGMGAVTCNTAATLNDAVDVIGGAFFGKKVFHVCMAGHADRILTLGPELGTILVGVGVVAYRAVPGSHRAVNMAHFEPVFFADMTLKAAVFNLAHRDRYFIGVRSLLMAGKALQVDGRAVFPVIVDDIFMAAKAERLGLTADWSAFLGRFILMTFLATGRQQFVTVEEKDPFFIEVDVEQGT